MKGMRATLVVQHDDRTFVFTGDILGFQLGVDPPLTAEVPTDKGYETIVLDDPQRRGDLTINYRLVDTKGQWL